jgi:hypothetical protein
MVTEKPRRVPVGGTAENAGVTRERVNAEDGNFRACPSVDRPATPRLLDINRNHHPRADRGRAG